MNFIIPAIPIAQPRQRHTREGRNYIPAGHPVHAFKATVRYTVQQGFTDAPIEGPLRLYAVFVLPRPKNMTWKTKPMPRVPHTIAPDADNLLKALQDSLNGLLWKDDAQVHHAVIEKWIASGSEQPHVELEVVEVT